MLNAVIMLLALVLLLFSVVPCVSVVIASSFFFGVVGVVIFLNSLFGNA